MHVRKSEIVFWIDQGWLKSAQEGQAGTVSYMISPEGLQRCLREHFPVPIFVPMLLRNRS
jgi:hypothetical protein